MTTPATPTSSTTPAFELELEPGSEWYWEGLATGELRFQRCRRCGHAWLPPTEECSRCLADAWDLERASGAATLVSWVIYRVAPHPAFSHRVPYNVAVVDLAEGVRTVTNLVGVTDWSWVRSGCQLRVEFGEVDGRTLALFRPVAAEAR